MKLTKKAAAIAMCVLFAILMMPIIITCFYTYPVLDDYNFGAHVHLAIMDGKNVLWAALENAHNFYMNWQGSYSANLLAGIQPFVFHARLYFLSNLAVLLTVSGIMLVFFYVLLCRLLGAEKSEWLLFTLPLVLVFWEFIPSIAEGAYWMDGSLGVFCLSFFYLGAASVIRFHFARGKQKTKWALFASAVSIFLAGASYEILPCYCVAVAACLVLPQVRSSQTMKLVIVQFILLVIGIVISLLSPGTGVRGGNMDGMAVSKAIPMAVYYGFLCFGKWMRIPTLCVLFCTCALVYPYLKKTAFQFPCPLLAAILCFGFYCGSISIVLAAKGILGNPRQENYYYLNFVMSMAVLSLYLTGWVSKHFRISILDDGKIKSPVWTAAIAILGIAGTLFTVGIHEISSLDTAWGLYKGYTQEYAAQMQRRIEILEDPEIADAVLEPLSIHTNYLIYEPLSEEPEFWTNQSVAAYYRKNSVRLTQEDTK